MIHTSLTDLVCCVNTYDTQALETRLSLIAVPVGSAMFSGGEPSSMTILSALPRNPTLQPTQVLCVCPLRVWFVSLTGRTMCLSSRRGNKRLYGAAN